MKKIFNEFPKFFLFSLLLGVATNTYVHGQHASSTSSAWSRSDQLRANTAKYNDKLNYKEKRVVYYINLARLNGKLFAKTYLRDYVNDTKTRKGKDYKSLVKTLNNLPSLSPLIVDNSLVKESIKHAKDMGKVGKKGHRSSTNVGFQQRKKQFKKKYNKINECNQYGLSEPLDIVVDLLIDEGVKSLTHRKSLLHKRLTHVGVGIRAHKKYQLNCSILLGGYIDYDAMYK